MYLEKQLSSNRKHETAILLIHGAFQGPWIWEDNFLPFFASNGYDTYAIDLTKGDAAKKTWRMGLQDLVNDLDSAIKKIGRPVVLIGHSLGSIIIQKYLEKNTTEAAILLCGVPPHGLFKNLVKLMKQII